MANSEKLGSGGPSKLLSAKEVAELTGLSMETLAQWRSQERGFPFIKISRNCVRYRQADLDCWLSERIVRTSQDPDGGGRRD
jgi:predicted DNA-binding transcriptional regulator AlpA